MEIKFGYKEDGHQVNNLKSLSLTKNKIDYFLFFYWSFWMS